MVSPKSTSPHTFDLTRLSTRERTVLDLAIEGLTDIQISLRLDISQSTVNSYWVRIRGKLGQLSRTELVALSLKQKAQNEMDAVNAQLQDLQREADVHGRLTEDYINAEIYRAALEAMPEAMLIGCRQAIIRYANPRLETMFGYAPGELIGQPIGILVPASVRERELARMEEYMQNPYPLRVGVDRVVYGQRRDGSLFRTILLIDSRPTSTGPIFSCVARDFVSEVETRRRYMSA